MGDDDLEQEGHRQALSLLRSCATEAGFLASPTDRSNYRRVWARDGAMLSLAALCAQDEELIAAARSTLHTLVRHQGPHGEIPSNVDPVTGRVSYGGTTGRVDADLWFVIACAEYWRATEDGDFLDAMLPALEKVRALLGAWEFNNRGLLYVPPTGDWADEYLQSGYVLYDQLLYLQTQRSLAALHAGVHGSPDHRLEERISHLYHLIRANYWFDGDADQAGDAYHEVLYRRGQEAAPHCADRYWLPSFSPTGYSYRFDAFANVLASLLGVADDDQRERVDRYIAEELVDDELPLLPAFHPVIEPVDEDWEDLQVMFSYTFKNKPYEFHNGGLWPMLTGFHAADLALRGRGQAARRYLHAVHAGNRLAMDGEDWSFPEFVHGRDRTPGGTRRQGWSAAAAVIAGAALEGREVFGIDHAG
ncbi:amylo-alpha-1,6-glucosidase [Thioalkalivibrio sp.]|uniref:amylo-alpha-1,6-glucosidase n=1 Tax=Thioalkalivibrio sp. TaxID=2093813 RepID=UPI003974E32E